MLCWLSVELWLQQLHTIFDSAWSEVVRRRVSDGSFVPRARFGSFRCAFVTSKGARCQMHCNALLVDSWDLRFRIQRTILAYSETLCLRNQPSENQCWCEPQEKGWGWKMNRFLLRRVSGAAKKWAVFQANLGK